ncbi:MAG: metallophosphoesterase [Clostridia bacterium]|nr:metallophosphoesterase [Clostridia bacterium]
MRIYTDNDYSKAYSWAEASTNLEYPDYLKTETKRALNSLKSFQGENVFNIAFITDIHYTMKDLNRLRMKRILNVYSEIAEKIKIERLVLGGDHICDACKEYKIDAFIDLKNQFGNIKFYPINGNHDDGTIWDMKLKNEISLHHLLPEERYEIFYKDANPDSNNLYYYSDDKPNKVRHIFLDSNDIDYIFDNGKLRYRGQDMFAFSQNQIDWLLNDALKFEEFGWSIMFYLHGIPHENQKEKMEKNMWKNVTVLYNVLDAYKNAADVDYSFGEGDFKRQIIADFSSYKRGEIIACVSGDTHKNMECISNSGYACITQQNAFPFYYDPPETERRDGDKTEVALAIITVDKNKRSIYVTRLGKGEDAKLNY